MLLTVPLYLLFIHTTGMAHFRIMNASQSSIHKFERLKRELYNFIASIHFNRQCITRNLTPAYARIKVPNTSQAHSYTQCRVTNLRIKDEIKFLHCKKQKLNKLIYHLHLSLANTWNSLWHHMLRTIEDRLQMEIRAKYKTLDKKLNHLSQQQTKTPN